MDSEKTILKPGRHLSVDETHRLIAHARRMRSDYLRASFWQLVAWVRRRWFVHGAHGGAGRSTNAQAASPSVFSGRPPLRRPLPPVDISRPRRLQTGTSAR
jgi:hypothetical protein